MSDLRGAQDDKKRTDLNIPIGCAPFNTSEFITAHIIRMDGDNLVCRSKAPARPGTIIITRALPRDMSETPVPGAPTVRTIGVAEVKGCRLINVNANARSYEMEMQYFKAYG